MFGHVAVAVDFSPAMDAMLRCLPGLRELGARRLTFIHVARLESPVEGWVSHLEYYERKLDELRPALEREGFEVGTVVVAGKPAEEIVRIAEEIDASLVLVGSRSASNVPGRFLGSVAWEVVQRASLPVLVQRMEPEAGAPGGPFAVAFCDLRTHVLFPTDFCDAGDAAFRYVEALARAGVPSFTLLNVRADEYEPWLEEEEVQRTRLKLERLADRLREAGAREVAVELPSGKPVDEVLRLAAEHESALVVLGTHGRGWLAKMMVGSVSHDLLRRSAASVLLVRVRGDRGSAPGSSTATRDRS
jgi:nucleotide-binding universal stress UspA family protein